MKIKGVDLANYTRSIYTEGSGVVYIGDMAAKGSEKGLLCRDCTRLQFMHSNNGCMARHNLNDRYCPCSRNDFETFDYLIEEAQLSEE